MPLPPLQDHELGMARREPGGDRQTHDPGPDDGERRVGHRAMIPGAPSGLRPQHASSSLLLALRSCCASPSRWSRRCSPSRTDAMPSIRARLARRRERPRRRRRRDGEGRRLLGRPLPLRPRHGLDRGRSSTLVFVAAGGLGLVESWARSAAAAVGLGAIAAGLAFFAILGLASGLLALPFDLYSTFRIEQKHGFNRQTLRGFFLDRVEGPRARRRARRPAAGGAALGDGAHGAELVAVGLGARGRLQPARGLDLPDACWRRSSTASRRSPQASCATRSRRWPGASASARGASS